MATAKPYSIAFGKEIREERIRQNLSQEELGLKCEVDRSYISGVERGRRNPTVQSAWKIATAGLQVSLCSLIEKAENRMHKLQPTKAT